MVERACNRTFLNFFNTNYLRAVSGHDLFQWLIQEKCGQSSMIPLKECLWNLAGLIM